MDVKLKVMLALFVLLSAYTLTLAGQSTIPGNFHSTVNVTAELNNSYSYGYNFTANYFRTNNAANCTLVQISRCDNNNPDQFVCINSAYYPIYLDQRNQSFKSNPMKGYACPDYILLGHISCTTQSGYCVVTDTSQIAYESNSSTTTTAPPYCQYGYICGDSASGCAAFGAIYNCPMVPANTQTNANTTVSGYIPSLHSLWDNLISFLDRIMHL